MTDIAQAAAADLPTAISIHRAARKDLEQIVLLDERVTKIAKPGYWDDIFERYATRRLEERFFLVAETGSGTPASKIVGFIVGEVRAWEFGSEPCGWIFALSVDPETRLRGIGEKLFGEISGRFRDAGVRIMRTMVPRENRLHMAFFRSEGMSAGRHIQLEMELDA